MKRVSGPVIAAILLIGVQGCAGRETPPTVMVPPRVDLKPHELIGVLQFRSTPEGELGPLATRRFTEWARRDQGLVRILEFGSPTDAPRSVGRERWDPETFRALGKEHGVRTLLLGEITVSDIRPDIRLSASMLSGHVSAQVNATLAVRLIETSTGASIWSDSASATKSVGHITMSRDGSFVFDADNPDKAYGILVDTLVEQVTRDFRMTWERR